MYSYIRPSVKFQNFETGVYELLAKSLNSEKLSNICQNVPELLNVPTLYIFIALKSNIQSFNMNVPTTSLPYMHIVNEASSNCMILPLIKPSEVQFSLNNIELKDQI